MLIDASEPTKWVTGADASMGIIAQVAGRGADASSLAVIASSGARAWSRSRVVSQVPITLQTCSSRMRRE
jgi:hypothetical protein